MRGLVPSAGKQGHYLEVGYVFASAQAISVHTVVGSCVSVCLWDKSLHCGGMNHFMYPEATSRQSATAQYGNAATIALIRMMDAAGCIHANLVAQIVGGGAPLHEDPDRIGMENVEVARRVLRARNIAIISEDVGGSMGRKIVFDTHTGELAVFKVHRVRSSDWIAA